MVTQTDSNLDRNLAMELVRATEAAARIAKILENEDARWFTFASARLRRFGYTVDRF